MNGEYLLWILLQLYSWNWCKQRHREKHKYKQYYWLKLEIDATLGEFDNLHQIQWNQWVNAINKGKTKTKSESESLE